MATPQALEALRKTNEALKDIRSKLKPYLDLLNHDQRNRSDDNANANEDKKESAHRIAVARTAVALSLGTLRYMGNRLRGIDQGRHAKDPLRQELDHMRKLLVALQKKGIAAEAAAAAAKKKTTTTTITTSKPSQTTTEPSSSSSLNTKSVFAESTLKAESGKKKRKSEGSEAENSSENPGSKDDGKRRKR